MPNPPRSTHHSLIPYPETRQSAVGELQADVTQGEHELLLRFRLIGDVGALLVPGRAPAVRTDDLWKHTCFEAFLAPRGSDEYCEYNFSPSTRWAAYHFTKYKTDMAPLEKGAAPAITVEADGQHLTLAVALDLEWLAHARGLAGTRLGLSAVIEDRAGGLSYWALKHVAEKPDFHRVESFVVELA